MTARIREQARPADVQAEIASVLHSLNCFGDVLDSLAALVETQADRLESGAAVPKGLLQGLSSLLAQQAREPRRIADAIEHIDDLIHDGGAR